MPFISVLQCQPPVLLLPMSCRLRSLRVITSRCPAVRRHYFVRFTYCHRRIEMEEHEHQLSKLTVIGDPQLLDQKIAAIRSAGPSKLQVLRFFFFFEFLSLGISFFGFSSTLTLSSWLSSWICFGAYQVIADFDATLTRYWIDGGRGQSMSWFCSEDFLFFTSKELIFFFFFVLFFFSPHFGLTICIGSHGLLRQENPEYDAKREALYNYYHPLEFSPTIPIEEKTKLMEEWYAILFSDTLTCLG